MFVIFEEAVSFLEDFAPAEHSFYCSHSGESR